MAKAKKVPVSELQQQQLDFCQRILKKLQGKSVPVEDLRGMIAAGAKKLEELGFKTMSTSYRKLSFEIYVMQRLYEGAYPLAQGNHDQLVAILDASAEPHAEDIESLEAAAKPKDPFAEMFD